MPAGRAGVGWGLAEPTGRAGVGRGPVEHGGREGHDRESEGRDRRVVAAALDGGHGRHLAPRGAGRVQRPLRQAHDLLGGGRAGDAHAEDERAGRLGQDVPQHTNTGFSGARRMPAVPIGTARATSTCTIDPSRSWAASARPTTV